MVWFLRALSNHCPRLFNSSLNRGTLTLTRRRHLILPRGHLLIVSRGCLESLEALIEAGSGLYRTVITRGWCGGDFRFTVVGHVGHVTGSVPATWLIEGGRVNLSVWGEGVTRRGGAVVIATGLITEKRKIFREGNWEIYIYLEDKGWTPVSFFWTHLTQIVFNKHFKCVGQMTLEL